MSTSSSTTLTFEASSIPWRIEPRPSAPAAPIWAGPDAAVSATKLSPSDCKPAGLVKLARVSWPSSVGTLEPGTLAETVPSGPTEMAVAPSGMVIAGWTG